MFTFEEGDAQQLALIGGGVGVTPLMSVLEHLHQRKATLPISVLFAFRSKEEIVFHKRLDELAAQMLNLFVMIVISDENDRTWTGATGGIISGHIICDLIRNVCPDISRYRVHLMRSLAHDGIFGGNADRAWCAAG